MTASISRRDFIKLSSGIILSAGIAGWGAGQLTNKNRSDLPEKAAPAGSPNVILIVMDTVRAKSTSLHGYERLTTPNLERLAKKGVVFNRAIAPASWTLPSHASIFTGQRPFNLSSNWYSRLDSTYPTLAEVLRQNGYQTAGFSANLNYVTRDFGIGRGFDTFHDFRLGISTGITTVASLRELISERSELGQILKEEVFKSRIMGEQIRNDFIEWLETTEGERPFFAFLNFVDAHDPYISPKEFYSQFTAGAPRFYAPNFVRYDPDFLILRELNDAYDGSIAYLDHQIDLLIQDLAGRGFLENSIVIITADHGEHFGDHDLYNHGNSLYMNSVHVPLIILFPGNIPEGMVIDENVSLINLASTVTDLTRLEAPASFSGKSLAGHWQNLPVDEIIRAEAKIFNWRAKGKFYYTNAKSLFHEYWHYIRIENGVEELYDTELDYAEENNLVASLNHKDLLDFFRAAAD